MSYGGELIDRAVKRQEDEERHRRKVEELKMKGLDEQVAHMGEERIQMDEVVEFWMYFGLLGMMDPPNSLMQMQAEFKVDRAYSTLSRFAASADVYSDPNRERRWKVLVEGAGGNDPYEEGLNDLL